MSIHTRHGGGCGRNTFRLKQRKARVLAAIAGVVALTAAGASAQTRVGSLADGSQIVAWGDDSLGQLAGIPVPGVYTAIAAGDDHSLALRADGSLAAWGYNSNGQVSGTPTTGAFTAVAGGSLHSLALRADGSIAAWGDNTYGQTNAQAGNMFTAIAAGAYNSLALRSGGSLTSWGNNQYGQVTNTPNTGVYTAIAVGGFHNLVLRSDGSLFSWGYDANGAVSATPTTGVYSAIAAGSLFNLALRNADGSIAAWGDNFFGETSTVPTGSFNAIAAGVDFGFALRPTGAIAAWAENEFGQVSNVPTQTGFVAVAAGSEFGIGLLGRTSYDGDLLVSGFGVTADLNRSITVAGDMTVNNYLDFNNNPTADVAGKLLLNVGAGFVGTGSIIANGLDVHGGISIPTGLSLGSTGPLSGSGQLSLVTGAHLTLGLAPAGLSSVGLSVPATSTVDFTGTGFQTVGGLSLGGIMRLTSGQYVRFTGAGSLSAGTLSVSDGRVEFLQLFSNLPAGRIDGTDATLQFTGGLDNQGNVNLSFGQHSISGAITNESGAGIFVTGNSNATFWDSLTNNTGGTVQITTGSTAVFFGNVVNNGTFSGGGTKFFEGGSTGVMGSLVTTGSTVVEAGAAITANRIREQALTVSGSAQLVPGTATNGASRVSSLNVTGTLDMTDNKMIVAGGTLGTFTGGAYNGITGLVASGRNGGQWNGPGIVTSSATPGSNLTTLGIASADQLGKVGQSFGGVTLNSGDVLVMYTYGGDANLDGKINIDDYGRIDGNVGLSGTVFGWCNGDFNYDGKINIDDYGIIDGNIGIQGPPIPTSAQSLVGFADAGVSAVPEPMSLGLLAVLGAGVLSHRRRG